MALILLIPILPLLGFAVQAFFGRRLPRGGDWVPLTFIGIALLLSLWIFIRAFIAYSPDFSITSEQFVWLDLTSHQIVVGLLIDNITAIMLMVVTVLETVGGFLCLGGVAMALLYQNFNLIFPH